MAPSVPSVSASLSMVVATVRSTGPVKLMLPSSLSYTPAFRSMFVPVMVIAPVVFIAFTSTCPAVTVRRPSFVVPPTAPVSVTAAVSASSVRA